MTSTLCLAPERWRSLREQSTHGCFPQLSFSVFRGAGAFGQQQQLINNLFYHTSACAADFNNNNNKKHKFMPSTEYNVLSILLWTTWIMPSIAVYISSSSRSSRSSQDWLLSSFPARCWPEAFNATFIYNIQRKGEDRIGWRRISGTTISTNTSTYHNHNPPLTLREQEMGGGKKGGKTSETQSHSQSYLFQI